MRLMLIMCTLLVLTACTRTVEVPENQFGVLLYMGEIKGSVSGPAKLEQGFLFGSVRLINKRERVELNNGKYIIEYEVVDPEQYYEMMGGNRNILEFLEKGIAKQALNGKAIKSVYDLYEIIDNSKLPIKIIKNS